MKAEVYIQGTYWATIDVRGDGLLALLAQGMIAQAKQKAAQLQRDLNNLKGVSCYISLHLKEPVTDPPAAGDQHHQGEITWPDNERPNTSSTKPTKP